MKKPTSSVKSSVTQRALPRELREIITPLTERAVKEGISVYLVGGCVRDLLLGQPSLDIDVVVEGNAEVIAKALAKHYRAKLISHAQFLTHTLELPNKRHIDITTARRETYPEPATLPVVEPASLQEDLYRRDFSINAMAISLNEGDMGHLWDPYGGMEDLQAGRIRVLHADSFQDDPTRIFRAARFGGRFNYTVDWRTRQWLTESVNGQTPLRLSGARLREELIPILLEKDPRPALALLGQWHALGMLFPHLKWESTHEPVFGKILKTPAKLDPLLLRILVLVHTLPASQAIGGLTHLMFPQKLVHQVEQALSLLGHFRAGTLKLTDASAAAKDLAPEVTYFLSQCVKIRGLFAKKAPIQQWKQFQSSTPCLTGRDILDLGYKQGPLFTRLFDALRKARWEGKLRTREEEIRFLLQQFPLGS